MANLPLIGLTPAKFLNLAENLTMIEVSTLGALAALVVAIALILKKVPPAYGMIIGALVGGVVGGVSLTDTVNLMIGGAQGIVTAVLRILAQVCWLACLSNQVRLPLLLKP